MTFNRFAGLGTLHALRTLVFRSRTAWLRRFQGRERDVRDESASVCLGGAGRQCIEAVLPLAADEVRVDVRAPSRSAVFRYGQHVSAVERVFTRHNPLVSCWRRGRRSTIVGLPPSAVPNFAKSL